MKSLLDQEQTNDNTSHPETKTDSEENLLDKQFKLLLLEVNQDTQDKYFNAQEELNTLT